MTSRVYAVAPGVRDLLQQLADVERPEGHSSLAELLT
jgi:hypothetical protein